MWLFFKANNKNNQVMNIALVVPHLSNLGPVIVAKDLCEYYVSHNHYCEVFFFDPKYQLDFPCKCNLISMSDKMAFEGFDIVHCHGYRPDEFVAKNRKRIKAKCITTLHQPITYKDISLTYPKLKSLVGSVVWNWAIKKFDAVVLLNDVVRKQLKQIDEKKKFIIFNGRDVLMNEEIEQSVKERIDILKNKYTIIGTTSNIIARKGLEQIIKALPKLDNFAFVAVGDGEERHNLEQLAMHLGVHDRCVFLGYFKNATPYTNLFDIFIMCSRSEGFPLAFIEAAACGKPTILSNIPIHKSIVSSDVVVFYELDNIDDLINKVKYVDNNKEKYAKSAHELYTQSLTVDKMSNRYLDLYNQLLS